jgi:molybdopterin molybdotransferase
MSWSVEEHAAHIAAHAALRWQPESVPLDEALGRVTAGAVLCPVDLPLFRNSQMDGFAVRAVDVTTTPTTLPIAGHLAARAAEPARLAPGTAVRIMTGAPVPEGADAVIPVEDTTTADDAVTITRGRAAGDYVRERGSDLAAGSELLPAGLRIQSRHLAALAAAGLTSVDVRSRVRIAIITTGSEIVPPGVEPLPGQVFDSNATALSAAIRAAGALPMSREHVADEPALMLAALDGAGGADLIITSGGISMGDHEVVREVLEPRGARVGHVAMQPGGPQATAEFQGVPVVCFPGNPVSTQLSFEVFLAPLLRQLAGLPPARRELRVLGARLHSPSGKRQFLRGRVAGDGIVEVSGAGSHLVAALAASDVLVIVPEDVTMLEAGETVETWAL